MLNILFRSDKCHIAGVHGLWMDLITLTTQSTLEKKKCLDIGWKVSGKFPEFLKTFRKISKTFFNVSGIFQPLCNPI